MSTSLPQGELKGLSCTFSTATGFAFSVPWAFDDMAIRRRRKRKNSIKHNINLQQFQQWRLFSGQGLHSGLVDQISATNMGPLATILSSMVIQLIFCELFLIPSPPVLAFLPSALKERFFRKSKIFYVKNYLYNKRLIVERFIYFNVEKWIWALCMAGVSVWQYSNSIWVWYLPHQI